MKSFRVLLFFALLTSSLLAVEEKWLYVHEPSIPGSYYGLKVLFRDSLLYSLGIFTPANSPQNVNTVLLRLDPLEGTKIWEAVYDRSQRVDFPEDAFLDTLGNLYLLLSSQNNGGMLDGVILKYAPDGTLLEEKIYDSGNEDIPKAFRQGKDGSIYVTGISWQAKQGNFLSANGMKGRIAPSEWALREKGNWDMLLLKYSPDLETLWTRRFDGGAGGDFGWGVAVDSSGNAYVSGGIWRNTVDGDMWAVFKYSSDGEFLWVDTIEPPLEPGYETDFAKKIEVGPDGNIYVLGTASGNEKKYDIILAKYNPDGETLFFQRCDNVGEQDTAVDMAIYRDGSIYIGGSAENLDADLVYLVAKFYDDGRLQWKKTYKTSPTSGEEDYLFDLTLDRNGNLYVTGTYAGDWYEFATLKYTKGGERIWVDRYHLPDEDAEAYSIALDENGDIYVAGIVSWLPAPQLGLLKYTEFDISAKEILAPRDTLILGSKAQPKVRVKSYYGNDYLSFPVKFEIGNFYTDDATGQLEPYGETEVSFDSVLLRDIGIWGVRSYTLLPGDEELANDTAYGQIVVLPGWIPLSLIPAGPKGKNVKDGGALVGVDDSLIYALKGNNTVEFYAYRLSDGSWVMKESLPYGPSGRRVKKGSALCYDGDSVIYAFKGSNTREFYAYNLKRNQWSAKRELPLGGGKNLKGGSALTYAQGKVYALKGSGTQEFYCYHPKGDSWSPKRILPLGLKNKKPKGGTSLAFDGGDYIYALKGGTVELWRYSISGDSWSGRRPCPYSSITQRRRYFKDGASLVKGAENIFFAFKGGNTQEFWNYLPLSDSWVELETIPKGDSRKNVKGGGALAFVKGKVYAQKGNNTREFWLYHANLPRGFFPLFLEKGVMAKGENLLSQFRVEGTPLFRQKLALKIMVPVEGEITLSLYNILGQKRKEFYLGNTKPGTHYEMIDLKLPSGVYILRAELKTDKKRESVKQKVLLIRR